MGLGFLKAAGVLSASENAFDCLLENRELLFRLGNYLVYPDFDVISEIFVIIFVEFDLSIAEDVIHWVHMLLDAFDHCG